MRAGRVPWTNSLYLSSLRSMATTPFTFPRNGALNVIIGVPRLKDRYGAERGADRICWYRGTSLVCARRIRSSIRRSARFCRRRHLEEAPHREIAIGSRQHQVHNERGSRRHLQAPSLGCIQVFRAADLQPAAVVIPYIDAVCLRYFPYAVLNSPTAPPASLLWSESGRNGSYESTRIAYSASQFET